MQTSSLSWLSHRQKPGGRLCSSDQWGINLRITSRAADNNFYVKLRLDTFFRKKVCTYGLKIWPIRMKKTVSSTARYFHVALRAAQLAMASLLPQYSSCLATSCKWPAVCYPRRVLCSCVWLAFPGAHNDSHARKDVNPDAALSTVGQGPWKI